jgi:hypothetical protein
MVRNGLKFWYKGMFPQYDVPQNDGADPTRKEKIKFKLLKALARGYYFEYSDVESLTHLFAVAKGHEENRMVYNDTSFGLNDCMWCPWFMLAAINNMLMAL